MGLKLAQLRGYLHGRGLFLSRFGREGEPICSMPTYSKVQCNHLIRFFCRMRTGEKVAVVYNHLFCNR